MIKKHKRTLAGGMRRTSRMYLKHVNAGKTKTLTAFLHHYAQVIRYFVEVFWSAHDMTDALADKTTTDRAVVRFGITARLAQMAAKQAKEMIRSQKERNIKRMPRFRNVSVNIDSRGVTVEQGRGSFDYAATFSSGIPHITILFNQTKHTRKFSDSGWTLSKSIRLGLKRGKLWLDLIFEKHKPPLKTTGEIVGIDRGFRVPLSTSRGELIGQELCDKIKRFGKRRKTAHYYAKTELFRYLKTLDLTTVKTLVMENLKYVKHNKRGTFPRQMNRWLSMWEYAQADTWLQQRCQEAGIFISRKNPAYTSQRCPKCGKIDRRNRQRDQFECVRCHFAEHADIVPTLNLVQLEMAGLYSARLLPNSEFSIQ